jgi:hypothetical protein
MYYVSYLEFYLFNFKFIKTMKFEIIILTSLISSILCQLISEDRALFRLQKTVHEKEALHILNEVIYQDMKFTNEKPLKLMYERKWMKATRLILDFLTDLTSESSQKEVSSFITYFNTHLQDTKSLLSSKKKNIVALSPLFEWSQDSENVKIRVKFAKNLESPGEKDIQNFKINCTRTNLEVMGYKIHEDYVAFYHRDIQLYEFIRPYTCEGYKETDGTYRINFEKSQHTMYWNFLDQTSGDHTNMYTWFDVHTTYDNKSKFTEFRDWTQDNLLMSDIDDYVKHKMDEKINRQKKISNFLTYLRTKDFENKNYCNSPVNEKFCLLSTIHDWNYWLS